MKVATNIYGLTDSQWKKARKEYAQAFGEDIMLAATPWAIKNHWLEIETPEPAPPPAPKPPKKRAYRSGVRRKRKEKQPEIPRPCPRQIFEAAMTGISYL